MADAASARHGPSRGGDLDDDDVDREVSAYLETGCGSALFRAREWLGHALVASLRTSTWFAVGLVTIAILAVWFGTYLAGGAPNPLVHFFYFPIILAAFRFHWRGAVAAAIVSGLAAGPLLPLSDASVSTPTNAWFVRLLVFVAIGILVAWLSGESSRPIRSFVHDARAARELRQAVQRGEFVAYYQPVVDLAIDRVVGWEALCRWLEPVRGVIPPAEFIPLAERTGAIIPVGTAILNAATCQAAAWIRDGADDDVVMAVNVSALQLCQPDFVSVVVAALGASGLSPKCLCLEITETAIVHQRTTALTNLTELHEMGVLIALDDFGTGHSTLAYLQDFPIDVIKIDLSFVSQIDHDPRGAALVLAIIQLAKALGVSTVGEGIERASQLDALSVMGCDLGQGYYLGRPAPPDAISAMLMSVIPHVRPAPARSPWAVTRKS